MKESVSNLIYKNSFKLLTALIILFGFLFVISPFILPVIFGGMLALAASPFVQRMMSKGHSRAKSLIYISIFLFFAIFIPLSLFFLRGFQVVSHFFSEQSFSTLTQGGQQRVMTFINKFSKVYGLDPEIINTKVSNFLNEAGSFVIKIFGALVSQIPSIIILSVITLFAFYFFLLKEVQIRKFFDRFFHFKNHNAEEFIVVLKSSSREVFIANVLTGLIQSSIVALGALISGIGDFYIVLFVTFILSFIPVVGAGPVAFLLSIIGFIDNNVNGGVVMAVVGVISGTADNFIRPYLSSSFGKTRVPIFVTFIAVIGGVFVLGITGLFVGPLLASLLWGGFPIIAREFFPQLEAESEPQIMDSEKNSQS
jgi:predicted PurR-regulated permease PerM